MGSNLLGLKLTKQFELFDIDGDRAITRQDFDKLFAILMRAKGLEDSSEVGQVLHQKLLGTWQTIADSVAGSLPERAVKSEGAATGREAAVAPSGISLEAFLASQEALLCSLAGSPAAVDVLSDLTLTMYDANCDGLITEEDFLKVAGAHGGDLEAACTTFRRLDLNANGVLSRDEVRILVQQFYLSEDPSAPGCWLFGPL